MTPEQGTFNTFEGRNIREYWEWATVIEAHFKIWPSYFVKEDVKVRRGLSMISNERTRDWYDVEPIIL
jgi:hypothetical protein